MLCTTTAVSGDSTVMRPLGPVPTAEGIGMGEPRIVSATILPSRRYATSGDDGSCQIRMRSKTPVGQAWKPVEPTRHSPAIGHHC